MDYEWRRITSPLSRYCGGYNRYLGERGGLMGARRHARFLRLYAGRSAAHRLRCGIRSSPEQRARAEKAAEPRQHRDQKQQR
jgi:hypothetical protein